MNKNLKILSIFFILSFITLTKTLPEKETTTQNNFTPTQQECPLCANGTNFYKTFSKLYGDEIKETNILLESKNFYVATDDYPVCEGHVLIIPREHKFSYSIIDKNLETELDAIIKTLSEVFETQQFGLFEHGSNMVDQKQKACGNSIYHAHMHFIPQLNITHETLINICSKGNVNETIQLKDNIKSNDYRFYKRPDQTILDFIKQLPTTTPYLFCFHSNTSKETFCIPDSAIQNNVPSQFFRRVFAEYFQKNSTKPFWNWKIPEESLRSDSFRKAIVKKIIERFKDKTKVQAIFNKNLGKP